MSKPSRRLNRLNRTHTPNNPNYKPPFEPGPYTPPTAEERKASYWANRTKKGDA